MTNRTFLTSHSHGWRWDSLTESTHERFDTQTMASISRTTTRVEWRFECLLLRANLGGLRDSGWQIIAPLPMKAYFDLLYAPASLSTTVPWTLFGRTVHYRPWFIDHLGAIGPEWLEKPDESYKIQLDLERCASRIMDTFERARRAA